MFAAHPPIWFHRLWPYPTPAPASRDSGLTITLPKELQDKLDHWLSVVSQAVYFDGVLHGAILATLAILLLAAVVLMVSKAKEWPNTRILAVTVLVAILVWFASQHAHLSAPKPPPVPAVPPEAVP